MVACNKGEPVSRETRNDIDLLLARHVKHARFMLIETCSQAQRIIIMVIRKKAITR
jgi:hypothetical protein